ncbi:Dihydroorotase [bioreactor metagenome]|uniref:Dihydroorotase n=1 Tax=bioreactor metagenome TaxID=1076179 RepID=A0A645DQP7_9ZZZZ
MSKRPSEILEVNKGTVDIGYDGDLVLIDIEKSYGIESEKFLSKGKNTPFNDMKVYGEVRATIKSGKVVYEKKEDDLDDYR